MGGRWSERGRTPGQGLSDLREMTTSLPYYPMARGQEAEACTQMELDSDAEPQRLFPLWKKRRGLQASLWGTAELGVQSVVFVT